MNNTRLKLTIVVALCFAFLAAPQSTMAASAKVKIAVAGVTCQGSAAKVQSALESCDGVKSAKVDVEHGCAEIKYDPGKGDAEAFLTAVTKAGFKCSENLAAFKTGDKPAGCAAMAGKSGCASKSKTGGTAACCAAKKAGSSASCASMTKADKKGCAGHTTSTKTAGKSCASHQAGVKADLTPAATDTKVSQTTSEQTELPAEMPAKDDPGK